MSRLMRRSTDRSRELLRRARWELFCVQIEPLETRILLSSVHGNAGLHLGWSHSNHGGQGQHVSTPVTPVTPITDLTATALTVSAVTGIPFHGDLATLTSASTPVNLKGCSYSVTIDWGDGTTVARGQIRVDKDGTIHLLGMHSYATAGTFSVTVTLVQMLPGGAGNVPLTIITTATVAQNSPTGGTIKPTAGTAFTGVVGTFTIPAADTTTDPATFKAYIGWGDYTFSVGTVTLNKDGSYSVTGTHTYMADGTFRVRVYAIQKAPSTGTPTPGTVCNHGEDDDFEERFLFFTAVYSTAVVTGP
jgi:hypothetical protein